ncbi:putative antirestriction adenine methyltransferase [Streptomyces rubrogriseus]|uniref:putative antirestriction adenine methyltransferase n=1 Tax=Streptomyces rubrogriseus TaxID=194673 RepID=UPI0037D11C7B
MGARTWSGRGKAEFEKFFDTDGRIEWDEPSYSVFDPDGGMKRLADHMEGKPALLMFLQEERTGVVTAHLTPGAGRSAPPLSRTPTDVPARGGRPRR